MWEGAGVHDSSNNNDHQKTAGRELTKAAPISGERPTQENVKSTKGVRLCNGLKRIYAELAGYGGSVFPATMTA